MTVPTHALERSLKSLTGKPLDLQDGPNLESLQELDQQFQIPFSGLAGSIVTWDDVVIGFDAPFYDATEQRDSPYVEPLFTFGAVKVSGSPVVVSAIVQEWKGGGELGISGATVAIGIFSPGTDTPVDCSGFVHLNFQGYGALTDNSVIEDVA